MWAYILRKLLINIPVYMGIIFLLMVALRVNDPVWAYLGKNASQEAYDLKRQALGLDQSIFVQYFQFMGDMLTLDFSVTSWAQEGQSVSELIKRSIVPSLSITVPALVFTSIISISIAIVSSYYRGRLPDRLMMFSAVLGMSISFLVYIIFGQYWGAYLLNEKLDVELFAIQGFESGLSHWSHYCLLPVLISTIVSMGYDTRFYRAVMVEESGRDYITTARAKGASKRKIMFVHMLKNAMIPIITRVAITIPFLITGSFLLERYFGIPGMGNQLLMAVESGDFPIVQSFTAVFAAVYIASNLLTDILYALVDPRVRLS